VFEAERFLLPGAAIDDKASVASPLERAITVAFTNNADVLMEASRQDEIIARVEVAER